MSLSQNKVNVEWDASVSSVLRGSFNQELGAFRDSAFSAVDYVRQVNLLGTFPRISRTENFSFFRDQVVSLTGVSLSAIDQGHSRKRYHCFLVSNSQCSSSF